MTFQYIYILQDLLGLLIAFLYSRLLVLSIKLVFVKGINFKVVRVLSHQLMVLLAGIILIISPWVLKTLILFLASIIGAFIIAPKRK